MVLRQHEGNALYATPVLASRGWLCFPGPDDVASVYNARKAIPDPEVFVVTYVPAPVGVYLYVY